MSEKLTEDSVRYKDGQKKKIKAMKDEIRDLEFKLEEKVHQVATLSNLIRSAEQVKGQHRDLRELHEKFVQKFHVLEESMASLQQEKVAIQDNLDSVLARCAEVEHEKTDLGYKFESVQSMNSKLTEKLSTVETELHRYVEHERLLLTTNKEVFLASSVSSGPHSPQLQ